MTDGRFNFLKGVKRLLIIKKGTHRSKHCPVCTTPLMGGAQSDSERQKGERWLQGLGGWGWRDRVMSTSLEDEKVWW